MTNPRTDEFPPDRPREITASGPPSQIVIRNPQACADIARLRDLLNAKHFYGKHLLSYASAAEMMVAWWIESGPPDEWELEKALEMKPKVGRPRKRPWETPRPRTQ